MSKEALQPLDSQQIRTRSGPEATHLLQSACQGVRGRIRRQARSLLARRQVVQMAAHRLAPSRINGTGLAYSGWRARMWPHLCDVTRMLEEQTLQLLCRFRCGQKPLRHLQSARMKQ